MKMLREVVKTAKTVEEATELALQELGVHAEDENVSVEVLELPQRKLFRTIPAKVRAVVTEDEPAPAPAAREPEARPAPKAAPAAPAAPAKEEAPAPKAPEPAPAAPAAAQEPQEAQEAAPASFCDPEEPFDINSSPKALAAAAYLQDVAAHMGVQNLTVGAVKQGETIILKAQGDNASPLIGHRGDVMEALSYLCSLCANRAGGDYVKIGVDVNGYRAKREANLVALAKRIAAKVARTGRSHMLEPMNPYERRIIHSAVTQMEGVRSESTGEGAARRVVIYSTLPNARAGAPRREGERRDSREERRGGRSRREGRSERRGRGERGERGQRSSVPAREFADKPRDPNAAPVALRRSETINDAEGLDLPLYGKIEL